MIEVNNGWKPKMNDNEQLQVKIAFLEDTVSSLSDEFYTQQKELDELKQQMTLLVEKLRNVDNGNHSEAEMLDEQPPHY